MYASKPLATALAVFALLSSHAMAADRTGKEVVEQTCASCHAEGKNGAPKVGDFAAWAQRAQGGFDKLAEHAISGKGKMPAHGGQPNLNDLEISRAIAYMASGGRAADPKKAYSSQATVNAEQLVSAHCSNCHSTGVNGAPRTNEFNDWKPRLQKGMDALVQSAVSGHNAMPSRAGLAQLSDTDLRNAAVYMVIQSASYKLK